MTPVLRFEDSQHLGPYRNPAFYARFNHYSPLASHPTGEAETWTVRGSRVDADNALYGFLSQAQLDAWFDADDQSYLRERGYTVACYRVHEDFLDIGVYQVRFDPQGAL